MAEMTRADHGQAVERRAEIPLSKKKGMGLEERKEKGRKNMRAITQAQEKMSTPISKRTWSRGDQRALTMRERSTERWLKECSLGQR